MNRARNDPRMAKLREAIVHGVRGTMELWSSDATTGDACPILPLNLSDLFTDMVHLGLE